MQAVDRGPELADGVGEGDVQGRGQRLAGVHHQHRDLLGLGRVALRPVRVEDRPVAHQVGGRAVHGQLPLGHLLPGVRRVVLLRQRVHQPGGAAAQVTATRRPAG